MESPPVLLPILGRIGLTGLPGKYYGGVQYPKNLESLQESKRKWPSPRKKPKKSYSPVDILPKSGNYRDKEVSKSSFTKRWATVTEGCQKTRRTDHWPYQEQPPKPANGSRLAGPLAAFCGPNPKSLKNTVANAPTKEESLSTCIQPNNGSQNLG
jgi:hypothetical protein